MWAANKRHSAENNAQFQFGKNGADFGAASEDDLKTARSGFGSIPTAGRWISCSTIPAPATPLTRRCETSWSKLPGLSLDP